jgi:DNA-binding NtrC family response regulator
MRSASQLSPGAAVILLTAYGSVPDAVTAMRDGALDYLTKPVSFDQLQTIAAKVMHRAKVMVMADPAPPAQSCGRSPALLRAIQRAARSGKYRRRRSDRGRKRDWQGTAGKVHPRSSDRSRKPFIAVNCAAVPESLLESELFGHCRGAFTGAVAAKPGKFELGGWGHDSCWTRLARCRSTCNLSF